MIRVPPDEREQSDRQQIKDRRRRVDRERVMWVLGQHGSNRLNGGTDIPCVHEQRDELFEERCRRKCDERGEYVRNPRFARHGSTPLMSLFPHQSSAQNRSSLTAPGLRTTRCRVVGKCRIEITSLDARGDSLERPVGVIAVVDDGHVRERRRVVGEISSEM